jgi:hypothetical protein
LFFQDFLRGLGAILRAVIFKVDEMPCEIFLVLFDVLLFYVIAHMLLFSLNYIKNVFLKLPPFLLTWMLFNIFQLILFGVAMKSIITFSLF